MEKLCHSPARRPVVSHPRGACHGRSNRRAAKARTGRSGRTHVLISAVRVSPILGRQALNWDAEIPDGSSAPDSCTAVEAHGHVPRPTHRRTSRGTGKGVRRRPWPAPPGRSPQGEAMGSGARSGADRWRSRPQSFARLRVRPLGAIRMRRTPTARDTLPPERRADSAPPESRSPAIARGTFHRAPTTAA